MEDQVQRKRVKKSQQKAPIKQDFIGEFDPGSGRTLAACLTHASRTEISNEACDLDILVADG